MKFLSLVTLAAITTVVASCAQTMTSEDAAKVWAGPGGHWFENERNAVDAEVLSRAKSACTANTSEPNTLTCMRQSMIGAFDISGRGATNCAEDLPQANWMVCMIDGNAIATAMEVGDQYSKTMLPSDWKDLNAARTKLVTEIKIRSLFTAGGYSGRVAPGYDSGRLVGTYRLDTAKALAVPDEMASRCTGADLSLITFCLVEAHSIVFMREHANKI